MHRLFLSINLIFLFRLCILSDMENDKLIKAARNARDQAHAPYSKFPVGAALLCRNGRIYTGSNIESSSYGLTICAERVALVKALSEGESEFDRMAIVAKTTHEVRPCGACLQMLWEYAPDLTLVLSNLDGEVQSISIKELLPYPFDGGDLPNAPT
jgi:cytidine deaminase